MKLPFKIAFRFLMSSRGQTILIALGIAVGVSVQIFIGSLISGLQLSLLDKTIGSSPHITITSEKKGEPIGANSTVTYAYIVFAILFIVLGIRSLFKQKKK